MSNAIAKALNRKWISTKEELDKTLTYDFQGLLSQVIFITLVGITFSMAIGYTLYMTCSELKGAIIGVIALAIDLFILPKLITDCYKQTLGRALFWYTVHTGLFGCGLACIFHKYTMDSVITFFLMTVMIMVITGIVGFSIKKNLSYLGWALVAAFGTLAIASTVGLFFPYDSPFHFVLSVIAMPILVLGAVFDMNLIKENCLTKGVTHPEAVVVIMALTLYTDFINIFLRLLRIGGKLK